MWLTIGMYYRVSCGLSWVRRCCWSVASSGGGGSAKITSLLRSNGTLAILDVDKKPFWKYVITYSIDKLLNPTKQLYYHSVNDMSRLLEGFPLTVKKVLRAHRGLPLSDIIYVYTKTLL